MKVERIGDMEVFVLIPSRYADGARIPEDLRTRVRMQVANGLTERFIGATGNAARINPDLLGSYLHQEGHLEGVVVDEQVTRVWSTVSAATIDPEDPEGYANREAVFGLGDLVASELDQECVAVGLGPELFLVYADRKKTRRPRRFHELAQPTQFSFMLMALGRFHDARDAIQLLLLDGWEACPACANPAPGCMHPVAVRDGRTAYVYQPRNRGENQRFRDRARATMNNGDLAFQATPDGAARVWLLREQDLIGGQYLRGPDRGGKVTRRSLLLSMSLLDSRLSFVPPLQRLLDQRELTARFFREYRAAAALTAEAMGKKLPGPEAKRQAQLLLGRLMFIQFIQQKGWMDGNVNYLEDCFTDQPRDFHEKALLPLFQDILDTPEEMRTGKNKPFIPYINGGLFRPDAYTPGPLPDNLFDPAREESILGLFRRYAFTLDEKAALNEVVTVDPSMFGHVLESLCTEDEQKRHGVHYTPPYIARELALRSVTAAVAAKAGVDPVRLLAFVRGDGKAIPVAEAQTVRDTVFTLRVCDPSVGSGALLLAAFHAILDTYSACAARLGEPLRKGTYAWSQYARRIVRECLYGVDIDPQAVEVARLRLWLAIAVGEDEARPLPDLGQNLRCGDSLSPILDVESLEQRELAFDELTVAREAFRDAVKAYQRAEGREARELSDRVDAQERRLAQCLLLAEGSEASKKAAGKITPDSPLAFLWHVHFAGVFSEDNRGFDVVIANPPYVSAQSLARQDKERADAYEKDFESMGKGAKDLYLGFLEQGMKLAGKTGQLAFIMPNFARSRTARRLRELFAERGAIDLFVDFDDYQVFPSANNYVALLFASMKKRRRRSFLCRRPDAAKLPPLDHPAWVDEAPAGKVAYAGDVWRTMSAQTARRVADLEKDGFTLRDLLRPAEGKGRELPGIGVGVQTSADPVFLLQERGPAGPGLVSVHSAHLGEEVVLERSLLRRCAKGSRHLREGRVESDVLVLWPYDDAGQPLTEEALAEAQPRAWAYLQACRDRLARRAMPAGAPWYAFGRAQGHLLCMAPKIVIPSIFKGSASAFHDAEGSIAFTASGKGGGGAWGIVPRPGVDVAALVSWLNSTSAWRWFQVEGDPWKDGWRGVDQAVLLRVPVPRRLVPRPR